MYGSRFRVSGFSHSDASAPHGASSPNRTASILASIPDALPCNFMRRFAAQKNSTPPWRQPRGKWMVSLVNSHTNATSKRWHLLEIDLRFALNSTTGWKLSSGGRSSVGGALGGPPGHTCRTRIVWIDWSVLAAPTSIGDTGGGHDAGRGHTLPLMAIQQSLGTRCRLT